MKKIIFLLTIMLQSSCFAYIYADTGDKELDKIVDRFQQQDIDNRLEAIEQNIQSQKAQEQRQWEKDLFDSIRNR